MQKEQLSALMDGEDIESESLSTLSKDEVSTWQRYHLIRDVLRGDLYSTEYLEFAKKVAVALEDEGKLPAVTGFEQHEELPQLEMQPSPRHWYQFPFLKKITPFLGQAGIAASVALLVIVGVQQHNQQTQQNYTIPSSTNATIPLPIDGYASPLSYGISTSISDAQNKQLQEQQDRIKLMLQDYDLQRSLHHTADEEKPQNQQRDPK